MFFVCRLTCPRDRSRTLGILEHKIAGRQGGIVGALPAAVVVALASVVALPALALAFVAFELASASLAAAVAVASCMASASLVAAGPLGRNMNENTEEHIAGSIEVDTD